MSGHRLKREPHYRPKAWKWGPPGYYCCGNRLMAEGVLPSGTVVHLCRHCGAAVTADEAQIVPVERQVRSGPPAAPAGQQLTLEIDGTIPCMPTI